MGETFGYSIPQEIDTRYATLCYGRFEVRFGYSRAKESRENDDQGQDYVEFRIDRERLAFALCDGVSQSFYGDIAARYLGDELVAWLWDLSHHQKMAEGFIELLRNLLAQKTSEASALVNEYPIQDETPKMVRDVLERKRSIGSETMFVCGCIDLPDNRIKDGSILLAWLGDSRLKLYRGRRDRTDLLAAKWNSAQRWSSKNGIIGGDPQYYCGTLRELNRLIAYSDGFESVEDKLSRVGEIELTRLVYKLLETPESDDASLLDIRISRRQLKTHIPLVAPIISHDDIEKDDYEISWNEVPGANSYMVQWETEDKSSGTIPVKSTALKLVEIRNIIPKRFRVRAEKESKSGPWSAWASYKKDKTSVVEE